MTITKYLHALAVFPAFMALISDTAEAARATTAQAPATYITLDPAAGKPSELTTVANCEEIDARIGRVLLTALHDASGQLDGAPFYAGRFIFTQARGR